MEFSLNKYLVSVSAFMVWLLLTLHPAGAAPVTQTVTLKPGWNAVFLEVDPVSTDCSDVFSGLNDLISVWTWNPRVAAVEFIQDPDTLVPEQPNWLSYFPDKPVLTTLYAIYGERPYLIKMGGAVDVVWTVAGEPRLPRITWKQDSFNLVGFHLAAGNEPFFEDFFSGSPAHAGQTIMVLNNAGQWEKLEYPALRQMTQGEAFWVYCQGHSDFTGSFSLKTTLSSGLIFGQSSNAQYISLANPSAADAGISMTLTGTIPLYAWQADPAGDSTGWRNLPLNISLSAGKKTEVRMGVRRAGLVADQLYDGNLTVVSDTGMRIVVPASVQGISHTGLWVGKAVVNKVSEARVNPDAAFPLADENAEKYATASDFTFRLILHVNEAHQVTLLRQVMHMWDEDNQRYVLFSDQGRTSDYTADKQSIRISSAAFGQLVAPTSGDNAPAPYPPGPADPGDPTDREPMTLSGLFGELGSTLSCSIMAGREDPMNPFRHRYHPDHKNADDAYDVIRDIQLTFAIQDSDGNAISSASSLGWGGSDMGGIYRETFTGLHRSQIKVEGTFLLKRVSDIGTLEQ